MEFMKGLSVIIQSVMDNDSTWHKNPFWHYEIGCKWEEKGIGLRNMWHISILLSSEKQWPTDVSVLFYSPCMYSGLGMDGLWRLRVPAGPCCTDWSLKLVCFPLEILPWTQGVQKGGTSRYMNLDLWSSADRLLYLVVFPGPLSFC